MELARHLNMPAWVPAGAAHYLAHTECGQPIRALARAAGCHASTVLRQIRQIEIRRDDPLVDAALRKLGAAQHCLSPQTSTTPSKERAQMADMPTNTLPDEPTLAREALRVLRRLCENGAVLAVASEMDKAVVVRDMASGGSTRTAVVAANIAQAMALKNWIAAGNTGRIVRYHITNAGRAALTQMLADLNETMPPAPGFAEAQTAFSGAQDTWDEDVAQEEPTRRVKYNLAESPLAALARRRDKKGKPFLRDDLVHAGERLREDFELAQMGTRVTQDWDRFLTPGSGSGPKRGGGMADAPSDARARVAAALADLGPGLSDVVLRCCCYLEGLEMAEKRLGWSARSGKIVLRIALIRLKRHYDETIGPGGPMIG